MSFVYLNWFVIARLVDSCSALGLLISLHVIKRT